MAEPSQKNLWSFLQFACFCAAVVLIIFHFFPRSAAAPRRLWTPIVVETNGTQTIMGETRQMEFWTPSIKTKDYLSKDGNPVAPQDQWEVLSSDDLVLQFGVLLHSDLNVLGYRRVESWGHGRTIFKPGWWWTVNVTTNYPVENLARAYQTFWKSPKTMFVEVIDNRGSDE